MNEKHIGIFGEVLFDQFPDGQKILGGAPFNVAWHTQAFGLAPCFISRVGNDAAAEKIRHAMQTWGMVMNSLQTDVDYPTGLVQITFNAGEPSYDILPHQAYDFIAVESLDLASQYEIIYHGTLAMRQATSAHALEELKARHQGKVFVDVNLREPWWQAERVAQVLELAHWVKLNQHELEQLQPLHTDLKAAMAVFLARYHLEILIVTRGEQGAIAMNQFGETVEVAPTVQLAVVDTVGAGDAFSAVLLLGLQRGWSLQVTMERARDFASAVVTQRGAVVQDLSFYQRFIEAW
ncbi:MAG: carbohydrate kinase [Methylococcales bacterium]|nr:carbohydrate kinase [Methylococcales bacterium]